LQTLGDFLAAQDKPAAETQSFRRWMQSLADGCLGRVKQAGQDELAAKEEAAADQAEKDTKLAEENARKERAEKEEELEKALTSDRRIKLDELQGTVSELRGKVMRRMDEADFFDLVDSVNHLVALLDVQDADWTLKKKGSVETDLLEMELTRLNKWYDLKTNVKYLWDKVKKSSGGFTKKVYDLFLRVKRVDAKTDLTEINALSKKFKGLLELRGVEVVGRAQAQVGNDEP
jgi:hypothetical protein